MAYDLDDAKCDVIRLRAALQVLDFYAFEHFNDDVLTYYISGLEQFAGVIEKRFDVSWPETNEDAKHGCANGAVSV